MSVLKTLEELAQDPSQSFADLSAAQREQIDQLKSQANYINANLMISDPDDPDDHPRPTPDPDDKLF